MTTLIVSTIFKYLIIRKYNLCTGYQLLNYVGGSFYNPKKVLESPFPNNIFFDKKIQCQIIIISMCLL